MRKLEYTFKTDTLFKMLFVQYPELLKKLVADLLGIPFQSIGQFVIRNPEMPPENLGDKFCRLDINMTVNGQRVDLEVQVCNEGDYPERVMYYWAREFSSALMAGQGYSTLPHTIVISIIDFILFDCKEYDSFFQPLEVTRHTLLSDKMGFHFFELPKLPDHVDEDDMLLLWLSLFKAETEDELEKIKEMEVPVMSQAINAYYTITASSEFREKERLRAKARHDEAQALYNADRNAKIGIARNMIADGESIEKIVRYTGLTKEIIENLEVKKLTE
ncbi:Rpn family recombination-promoting nuclease/putative transposase [bacterium D16-54]|nr:Rpn family recombination-promoting nuclease/putative transposase [bacterium D16-54]RKJ16019.1 Rpn family recombination-promoting nuclease/putative transposase [bacterium D16-56]